MNDIIRSAIFAPSDPPPYGDGLFANEPPAGNGLNITDLFHIVEPKPDDPDINSAVDSKYPNVAIITHDTTNQFGGMWAKQKLDLTMPFSTEMYLHLGHQYNKTGTVADGMTFTLQNDPAGLNAIGGAGEGLGVYKGRKWTGVDHYTTPHGTYLRNSLVTEFDTYRNSISEGAFVDDPGNAGTSHSALLIPRADIIHISDHQNVFYFTPTQEWARFNVEWIPNGSGGGTLNYSFAGQQRTYMIDNVIATFGDTKVYWGFTGSTGELTSVQAAAITRLPSQGLISEKMVDNEAGENIDKGTARPGDILTYRIRVTAASLSATIGPIMIVDEISEHVEYVGGNVRVTTRAGAVYEVTPTFAGAVMSVNTNHIFTEADDWLEVSFAVKVRENAGGTTVYNKATIMAEGLSGPEDTNTTEVAILTPPKKEVSDRSEAGRDGGAVNVGDLITYDITYTNYEATAATVVITDRLPSGVDFLSATNGGTYNSAAHTVTWTLAGVPVGAGGAVSVVVRVNQNAVVMIENYASVQVGGNEPQVTNRVDNPVITVPEKKVSDSSEAGRDGSAVMVGDEITYDIIYTNYEAVPATVVIMDMLPAGVGIVSATNGGIYNSITHTVIWTLADVPSGASGTVSVVVRVNHDAVVMIENYATVQVGDNEPRFTNIVENQVMPEKDVPDESEAGKDGGAVKAGDRITYDITYANYDTVPATVIITDPLNAGVNFVSATDGGTYNSATHTVTWTLSGVPGASSGIVSLVVRVNLNAVVKIDDYAIVQVGDNEPRITNTVENPVIPEKHVSGNSEAGIDGEAVQVGDQITYDITYANYDETAATVVITDVLPAGVDFVSATSGSLYDIATHTVTWTLTGVPGGAGGTVSVVVRVNQYAIVAIEDYATVRVGDNEPRITNTVENPVIVPPGKTVSGSSEAGEDGGPVKAGDRITYDITYMNDGEVAATVIISDRLPAGVDFVSATNNGMYNNATHTVTWTLADVPGGTGGTVSVVVRVNLSAVVMIENDATVQVGDNEPQVTNRVENPVITLPEKEVSQGSEAGRDGGAVGVGDQVTYNITYLNHEAAAATVIITDRLPAGMDFVSATNDGIYDMGTHTVTWTLTGVPGGAGGAVSVAVRVNRNAVMIIENHATVQVGDNEPLITNSVVNPVITFPEKKVSDNSEAGRNGGAVTVGDLITYDIIYTNFETTAATIVITDRLPTGTDFVSATSGGIYDSATHTVIWTLTGVFGSVSGMVSLVVRVNQSTAVTVENYATVRVGDNEPLITNRVENPVTIPPEKKVSDSSEAGRDGSVVTMGDQITYDIIYTNFETTAATVVIADRLPDGVDFVAATNGGMYNNATHTVIWILVDVPGGVGGTVSVVVRVNQTAVMMIENDATVRVGDNEPQITNRVNNPVRRRICPPRPCVCPPKPRVWPATPNTQGPMSIFCRPNH